ncbi:bifunctional DNA primase/polymerase [Streptomyces qinzhouensis]|uniref:bifunctional DNA primase/polymerase n=1 Tax=Streptomyces qinzhouensis TaxID=2599401 RepID=UPI001FEB6AE3|nr:bifunctional DNA primase/polymerase [Streptomyces qinzhouensis]
MTHDHPPLLQVALDLARRGVSVLPLREKRPPANCSACRDIACGGRPHMREPGPCRCPLPCHGWAAATTDPDTLTSPQWAADWHHATAVAYHPGGAGLTVVDLDNPAAVTWAHRALPPTRTVATTRGEHWIYRGTMQSRNAVRDGVDIKSLMQYARWLGPGTGTMAHLPDVVRALVVHESPRPAPVRPSPTRDASRYAVAVLDREAASVATTSEGGRQAALLRAVRAVGRFVAWGDLDRTTVETAFTGAAESAGLPPGEYRATIRKALDYSIRTALPRKTA